MSSYFNLTIIIESIAFRFSTMMMLNSEKDKKSKISKSKFLLNTGTIFFAILTITLSLACIIGWLSKNLLLIQYIATSRAIAFNAVICYLLLGISIITTFFSMRKISLVLIILAASIATITLFEIIFNIDLHIDMLVVSPFDPISIKYHGRMAPNAALNIDLIAIAIFLLNIRLIKNYSEVCAGGIGLLTLSLSSVFISGYFIILHRAYQWGTSVPIAFVSCVLVIILSLSLIFLSLSKSQERNINIYKFIPFLLTASLIIGIFLIYQATRYEESIHNYGSAIPSIILLVGILFSFLFGGLVESIYMITVQKNHINQDAVLLRATLESTSSGLLVTDMTGKIINCNQQFLEMWGLTNENLKWEINALQRMLGSKFQDEQKFYYKINHSAKYPDEEFIESFKLKNGDILEMHIKKLTLGEKIFGQVWSYMLLHQSKYDALTGLPNKAQLMMTIDQSLRESTPDIKNSYIFLIDVDKFSQINDLFGYSKGDILLMDIAGRLKKNLPKEAVLGRVEGDVFLVFIGASSNENKAMLLIDKLKNVFYAPFDLVGHQVIVGISMGISCYPNDGEDTHLLINNANLALSRAKKIGYNQVQFFTQEMNELALTRMDLESQLQKAVEQKQFINFYQPILDLKTGKIVGVEALARWNHPTRGITLPDEFIPLAEEMGLIYQLGEQLLYAACKQGANWHKSRFKNLNVAVNFSAEQFEGKSLTEKIKDILKDTGFSPNNLEFELTESILMKMTSEEKKELMAINDLEIKMSIDDFGTGYSSFNYIREYPIKKLKIDKIFIKDIDKKPRNAEIVKAIVLMANTLGFTVLTEGVETQKEFEIIRNLNCDQVQGLYVAKPMPAEECTIFMEKFGL